MSNNDFSSRVHGWADKGRNFGLDAYAMGFLFSVLHVDFGIGEDLANKYLSLSA